MKVIAFMKYSGRAASTRQRLLQYIPYLNEEGIQVEWFPLIDDDYINRAGTARNVMPLIGSYFKRLILLTSVKKYDLVWIHKELFPFTPGWFEALIARAGVPIIYDFDDAIFHNYNLSRNSFVRRLLGRRFEPLLQKASAVSCGNAYLREYAERFCSNSVVIPTVVDTSSYCPLPPVEDGKPPVIGWIGSFSTWQYVKPLVPMLESLVSRGLARVRIVGAGAAAADYPTFEMVEWSESTEIAEVQRMHIGIMPLANDPWSQGKCGYKLIQYMACGLPVVASPVGVNADLAQPGVNGILADTPEEWHNALIKLLDNAPLRTAYGEAGRSRIEKDYSLNTYAPKFLGQIFAAAQMRRTNMTKR